MAWSWAFLVFLLAFGVNAEDLCASARKSATQASSFCDPKRINAYIECKDGRDVVSTCPDGLSWSLKIQVREYLFLVAKSVNSREFKELQQIHAFSELLAR